MTGQEETFLSNLNKLTNWDSYNIIHHDGVDVINDGFDLELE